MNVRAFTNTQLIAKTDFLISQEREILVLILRCFCEIERRRLFSDYKTGSMYEFIRDRYQYSNDQVYRRLDAMRLLRELPEIEEKIVSGDLNLTHLNLAHTHFKQERKLDKPLLRQGKLDVLEKIANQTTERTKQIVSSLSSNREAILKPDRVVTLTEDKVELTFSASKAILEKIAKLRGKFAHTDPNIKFGELFEKLCDLQLDEKPAPPPRKSAKMSESKDALTRNKPTRKHISLKIHRDLRAKADNQCELCKSTYALQTDHIIPKGGSDEPENLRLLCRNCNQRQAQKHFRIEKMEPYLTPKH